MLVMFLTLYAMRLSPWRKVECKCGVWKMIGDRDDCSYKHFPLILIVLIIF